MTKRVQMLVKLLDFVKGNRDSLIIVSLLIGLYGAYQDWNEKQIKWVDGWSCSYWDSKRNSHQSMMDSFVADAINGRGFENDLWENYKLKRDEASKKFNQNCLPPSAYWGK